MHFILFAALTAACSYVTLQLLISRGYDFDPAADSDSQMNAIVYESHGNSSVLEYKTVNMPLRKDGYVLIKVKAASLNPCDYKMRRNPVPTFLIPLPKIPGGDVAGVVVSSDQRSAYKSGDKVAAMLPLVGSKWGGYSEYVSIKESLLARIPEGISFRDAASLPLVSLTTIQALDTVPNPAAKTILIHAGSGGVGTFAVQYAKHVLNLTVAVTCSAKNQQLMLSLGADKAFDYNHEDFGIMLRNTGGVDIILDPMSYHYEKASLVPGKVICSTICTTLSSFCITYHIIPPLNVVFIIFDLPLNNGTGIWNLLYYAGVISPGGSYLNIVSSDFELANGMEVANDAWTFISPFVSIVRRYFNKLSLHYTTVLVTPDGKDLARVMKMVGFDL